MERRSFLKSLFFFPLAAKAAIEVFSSNAYITVAENAGSNKEIRGNRLLTPREITAESLRILHEKLHFTSSINRNYNSHFRSAKSTIKIRVPNEYSVRV